MQFKTVCLAIALSSRALAAPGTPVIVPRQENSLTLDPKAIQSASALDGSDATGAAAAGQVKSVTSTNNFINNCVGKTLTNGLQVQGGSCNGITMGDIPAKANMVSSIITFPTTGGAAIKANTDFTIKVQMSGLVPGAFTNAASTYYAAPQALQGGLIVGHTHVTVQDLGNTLNPTTALDPTKFAFFKGINDAGDGNLGLSAVVTGGLPAGNYRVCTLASASNHQPVLMPVAQRGTADDCTKFVVSADGGAADDDAAGNGGANGNGAAAGNGGANGNGAAAGNGGANGNGAAAGNGGANGNGAAAGNGGANGNGAAAGNGGANGNGAATGNGGAAAGNGGANGNGAATGNGGAAGNGGANGNGAAAGNGGANGNGAATGNGGAAGNGAATGNGGAAGNGAATGNGATAGNGASAASSTSDATSAAATKAAATGEANAAAGENVQKFTGAVGGIKAPAVIKGAGDRPFTTDGSTFVNSGAAIQRSCSVQHNLCANLVNSGKLPGGMTQCETQQAQCDALIKKRSVHERRHKFSRRQLIN